MQSFSELPLSAEVARAIHDLGFEKPSPIQAETLPILLGDRTDFLGLAATGTGKTAAFTIPMLEGIEAGLRRVQALILCPTRELALQVAEQVSLLGRHKGVRPVAVYGGSSYVDQIQGLTGGASVVVGTPGRVVDHLERGTLKLDHLKTLILDEADEMISMGFKEELEKILSAAPRESSNIWLFSATMSREVRRVADEYLREPKLVQINRTEMLPSTIEQYYYPTAESNKPEILCKLIEAAEDFYGLVFCQTKSLVVDLAQYLHERGYKVDSLHGDKDQSSRERTMQSFRDRKVTILVCTDVASRGLDVKDITHVINYSLPRELDNYVHRIGRTARSGKTGIAMNLVTASHRRLVFQIENMTKTRMVEGKIPTRREIGARKVSRKFESFNDQPYFERALEVMDDQWKEALAKMTPEEVAARFLTSMMPEVFNDKQSEKSRLESKPRASGPSVAAIAPPLPQAVPARAVAAPRPLRTETEPRAEMPPRFERARPEMKSRSESRSGSRSDFRPDFRRENRAAMPPRGRFQDRRSEKPARPMARPGYTGPRESVRPEPQVPGEQLNRRARRALKFGVPYNEPGEQRRQAD